VTETPIYVWRGGRFGKSIGAWRLALDREVTVRSEQGRRFNTRELFFDRSRNVLAAEMSAPLPALDRSRDIAALRTAVAVPRDDLGSALARVQLVN
jgi:hypothetical protein